MAARIDMNDYKISKIFCSLTNQACENAYCECSICDVKMGRDKMAFPLSRRGGF